MYLYIYIYVHIYIYIYIYICIAAWAAWPPGSPSGGAQMLTLSRYVCMYIYIYRERERTAVALYYLVGNLTD